MRFIYWTLTVCFAASAIAQSPKPEDVVALDWGATPNVSRLDSLYFAGQVDLQGLEKAKEVGVSVVINLRGPDEYDWDEAVVARELGLLYFNVPVTGPSFDPEAFDRIEKLVDEHGDGEILIHCGSSNRVGGWLATHLVRERGMNVEDALAVGRAAGITSPAIERRVLEFLEAP